MSAAPSKHEDRFTIVTIHAMNEPINRLMKLGPTIVMLVIAALQLNQPVRAESAIVNAGNALQILMPLGAAGISAYQDDDAGLWQLVKSEVVTAGITYGLKYTVNSTSPDGQQHSFPSGHASITFSAAQFLQTRYGWEYGVPAYALASFTAYSRVSGDQHYWGDVLAGAAIGMASSYFFTTPFKHAQMSVIATPTLVGLQYRERW
jgi:membrane-associated phospholipid phosphatase